MHPFLIEDSGDEEAETTELLNFSDCLKSLATSKRKENPTMDEITAIIQSAGEKRKVAKELEKQKAPRPATPVMHNKKKEEGRPESHRSSCTDPSWRAVWM